MRAGQRDGQPSDEPPPRDFDHAPLLAHIAGVAERVTTRLRPYRKPVRLATHRYAGDLSCCGVYRVDDVIVSTGKPQRLAVGTDVAHIRAAAARDRPGRFDLQGGEIDHRNASLAVRRTMDLVRSAIGDIELLAVSTR